MKSALEVNLEEQSRILNQLLNYMETMTFNGTQMPFQKGMIMAIKAALQLQHILETEVHSIWKYLKTIFNLSVLVQSTSNLRIPLCQNKKYS